MMLCVTAASAQSPAAPPAPSPAGSKVSAPPSLSATAPIATPAYTEPVGPQLTIDQAVQIALDTNPNVTIAKLTLKRTRYQVQQITGQAYPQIKLNASDTYSSQKSYGGGVTPADTTVNTAGLDIPTIIDTQSGSAVSSVVSSSTTASTNTTTGSGSSTTASTVTIVPVGSSGSSSSSTDSTTTGDARSASGSSQKHPLQTTTTTTSSSGFDNAQTVVGAPRNNNYGAQISLSQLVDINGLVSTSERALKEQVAFYQLDLTRVANETAYSIKSAYFAVLKAEQQYATEKEQVSDAQADLNDAQLRFNAGTTPQYDVVSAQTQLSNAQQNLINAQITLEVQRANLNNLLNRPIDTPFTPVNTPIPALPAGDTDQDEIATALKNRPELQQADLTVDIAAKLVKLDRAGLLPSVSISASSTYDGEGAVTSNNDTDSAVTASVSLPLYDGGQTAALVNEAKTEREQELANKVLLVNDVELEVRAAFVNVANGASLVQADIQGVAESRESLRLANIRYRAGTGTLLEVTDAQANLAVAETNLSSAQFQLQTEYASLIRSEGLR